MQSNQKGHIKAYLLIWRKKEKRTAKKSKIIDSKSLDLLNLGTIRLNQLIKSNKWQQRY